MSVAFKHGFKSWCENCSINLRKELGVKPIDPLDPLELAEYLNMLIWKPENIPGLDTDALEVLLRKDSDSWSAVSLLFETEHIIIINSTNSKARQSSDIMHEISHTLLDHEPSRIDISEDGLLLNTYNKLQEEEASWLAGTLLLPREALLEIKRRYNNMGVAARHYKVSNTLLQYRFNISGVNYQYKRTKGRFAIRK